jgi:polar amino acid transport system permease protein
LEILDILVRFWPLLAEGLLVTAGVSAAGIALAFLLAVPLAAMKLSHRRLLRLPADALIELLRNAPFIVLLFLVHFGIGRIVARLPAWETGTIALALYGAAYFAEVLRSAWLAVPGGQLEAARSLGLSGLLAVRLVMAPQMLRAGLPPSRVVAIMLLKDSAILSVISVPELTHATLRIQAETFDAVGTFAVTALLYWLLTTALATLLGRFETAHVERRNSAGRESAVAARYLVLDWDRRSPTAQPIAKG